MHAKVRNCVLAAVCLWSGGAVLDSTPARAEFEIGVMGGGKFFSGDAALSRRDAPPQDGTALANSGILGLRLGFLPIARLGIEAELGVSPTAMVGSIMLPDGTILAGAQVAVVPLRAHLLVNLLTGRVRPFLLIGGGAELSAPMSVGIVRADGKGEIHAGAGLAFNIGRNWGLRFDGRFELAQGQSSVLTPEGEVLGAIFARFGSAPPPAAAPPPAPAAAPPPPTPPAAPPPCVTDSDSDGIVDSADRCPHEAGPAQNFGCPLPPPPAAPSAQGLAAPSAPPPVAASPAPPSQVATQQPPSLEGLAKAARRITFEPNSAVLTPASRPALDQMAQILLSNPAWQVEIEGHTDSSGDAMQNRKLSQDRAEAVRQYLVEHGFASERLHAQGYGSDRPLTSNATPEGRAQNRRIEVKLLPAR